METILNETQLKLCGRLEVEVSYFLEYTREIVLQVILWEMNIEEMLRQTEYIYDIVKQESKIIDEAYERGDYGRPGIMDGGPNYAALFYKERERCIKILRGFNTS